MQQEIIGLVNKVVKELFDTDVDVVLTRPDEQFGDYATNVALQLIGRMANPPAGGPREIAESITQHIQHESIVKTEASIAHPQSVRGMDAESLFRSIA